jgi:integrase
MLYRRGQIWWYEFLFMGQRVRESSHSPSRTVARDAERQRRRDLEESVNGLRDKRRRPLLFSVAAREYLEWKKGEVKPSTHRIESKSIDHLSPVFGKLLLADINGRDVARYQQARAEEGAAGATINLEIGTLRSVLRRHRLWGQLQPDVKKRPERDDVGQALTADEETRLLLACQSSRSRCLYPAVVLALNTGLRRSELLNLRWGQIAFTNKTVRVGDSKTRAGRGRIVPLNARATAVLGFWAEVFPARDVNHAVFPTERIGAAGDAFAPCVSETDSLTPIGSIKEAWEAAKRRANVKVRWHDLRHTCCTRLLEQGVSLPIIGRILGWAPSTTVRMAQRYGHIGQDAQRQAMALLDPPKPKKPKKARKARKTAAVQSTQSESAVTRPAVH